MDARILAREGGERVVRHQAFDGALAGAAWPARTVVNQPRVSATYVPFGKTVFKGGFGIFVGPGQTEDQIQPIEAERISTTLTSGPFLAFPVDANAIRANFINNPNNPATTLLRLVVTG